MHDVRLRLTVRDVFGYTVAYLFWLAAAVLGLGAIFMLREALNAFWPAVGWSKWLLRPLDRFGLVLLGLVWLVYVIFCEQYYRSSITEVRIKRMRAEMGTRPQEEDAGNKRMGTLKRLGLDILARRLLPTLGIPLIALGLGYLVYSLSWVSMTK